uniref:tRNA N(3)-cytidine methyltransferase n=1 Tax=Mastacembelus armatus TaxID=205130 RepID=A0A7N8WZ63_9TELE
MHKLRSLSTAKLAEVLSRLSTRLKSTEGRPSAPLGSRFLTNPDDIFNHNMWDHVQWTEDDKEKARQRAEENSSVQIPLKEQGKFDTEAWQYWDKFYEMHQNKFFKDRKWLFLEFPELLPSCAKSQVRNGCQDDQQVEILLPSQSRMDTKTRHHLHIHHCHRNTDSCQKPCEGAALENNKTTQTPTFPGQDAPFRILEVGCGVGNSVFPIVNSIKETNAFLYCCDFSPRAIQLVKDHPDYDDSLCHAFVHDICKESTSFPFPPQSLDVILAIFVLSSIHPQRIQGVVNQLSTYLKHGGIFLFRDYGRYDLSQLRFKKEEVHDLFFKAGLEEIQNLEDKRLQVNRGKKVAMHRVWMQSKYCKLHPPSSS